MGALVVESRRSCEEAAFQHRERALPGLWSRAFTSVAAAPAASKASWMVCALAFAAFCAFVMRVENDWYFILPVIGAFVFLAALSFALSRRPRLSLLAAFAFYAAVWGAAVSKFQLVAMNLHVYDVVFFGTPSQFQFLLSAYPANAWLIVLAVSFAAAILTLGWRLERPAPLRPGTRLAIAALAGALMAGAATPLHARNGNFFSEKRFVFSAFLSSFGDLPQLLRFNGLIETGPGAPSTPSPLEAITCAPAQTPPDIVLFLNESAMPPGVYPGLVYPDELKPFFAGGDGRIHPLRVETFGGGTWLTDFSALTGLSTRAFGSMRNFVANFMTGRLRHSLPQYLKACGYETSVIYPASADFAGTGRFYKAIGFDRVVDLKIHRAPDQRQRDAFYLGEAAKILEANAASPAPKPQFIAASSMSTHSPWDFRFAPEMVRDGENTRWNQDPEFDEYLWRLVLAKRDRDAFRARLAEKLPGRQILHIGYGDHQPALARLPLEGAEQIANDGTSWQLDPASKAFETYFSVEAQGFEPQWPGRELPIVEVAHLATITVMAAGLPLDPVYQRRARLLETCKGLYAGCADRAAVLTFQRWLVDNQWITRK